jgi:hypothetical protein
MQVLQAGVYIGRVLYHAQLYGLLPTLKLSVGPYAAIEAGAAPSVTATMIKVS